MSQLPNDLDELRRLIAEEGGNMNTKTFLQGETVVRQKAQEEVNRREQVVKKGQSRMQQYAAQIITGGLQGLAVVFTLVILLVGTLLGIILLLVAEIAAVQKGFAIIDQDFAFLYAAATVLFFFVVLFIGEVIRRSSADEERPMFSLRHLAQWLMYFIGRGSQWRPRYKKRESLMVQVDQAVKWLMYTIVIFGMLGRLSDSLSGVPGNWRDAINYIWNNSTFGEMFGYIGSVVMTIALLLSTHFVVFFTHLLFVQTTGGLNLNFSTGFSADLFIEAEVVKYYQNHYLKLRAENQQKLLPSDIPTEPSETMSGS